MSAILFQLTKILAKNVTVSVNESTKLNIGWDAYDTELSL